MREVERVHLWILAVCWLLHSVEAEVPAVVLSAESDGVVLEVAKGPLRNESR